MEEQAQREAGGRGMRRATASVGHVRQSEAGQEQQPAEALRRPKSQHRERDVQVGVQGQAGDGFVAVGERGVAIERQEEAGSQRGPPGNRICSRNDRWIG